MLFFRNKLVILKERRIGKTIKRGGNAQEKSDRIGFCFFDSFGFKVN